MQEEILGFYRDGEEALQTLALNREQREHILCVAKNHEAWRDSLYLPLVYFSCLSPHGSTIVFDSKARLGARLASMARSCSPQRDITLFNPLEVDGDLSWNILAKLEDNTDCRITAHSIMTATDPGCFVQGEDPFFRNNALALLTASGGGWLRQADEVLSFTRVREMSQLKWKDLCAWLENQPPFEDDPYGYCDPAQFIAAARFNSPKAHGIIDQLQRRLDAFALPALDSDAASYEFDLEIAVKNPSLFIINCAPPHQEKLRPVGNVMAQEILRYLTKTSEQYPGGRLPHPIRLVFDDFTGTVGQLASCSDIRLGDFRRRDISFAASVESIAALNSYYGDDSERLLAGFGAKIFMPDLDPADAEWAAREAAAWPSTDSAEQMADGASRKGPVFPADNLSTFFLPDTPVFQRRLIPYCEIQEICRHFAE
jgi:type IV secretory pathway TraG/TraD family ATPase VirD4